MNAIFMPKMLTFSLNRRHAAVLLALFGLAAGIAAPAHADKADRAQPLNFAADAARVDESRHLNILTGNVEITKGSMVVRANRVEVQQNADGTQTATAIGGPGGRAYFRQKRDGVDEAIEGEAERLVYDGRDDTVHFLGRAIMRRLKPEGQADEVAGQTIVYDNKTSVFQVVGTAASGSTGSKGRVRGVITPRPAAVTPAPASAPTPASSTGKGG